MSRRKRVLPSGAPVRHSSNEEVIGTVCGHFWERGATWYVIDWIVEGYAPCIKQEHVSEVASPLHLLAAC